jgi:hypothetical protein
VRRLEDKEEEKKENERPEEESESWPDVSSITGTKCTVAEETC